MAEKKLLESAANDGKRGGNCGMHVAASPCSNPYCVRRIGELENELSR